LNRRPNPPLTDAAREAQLCIKLEPNNADAHFGLGFVYVYGGKPDSAIKYHQATLRLDPANKAEIENEIAVTYFGKEDFDTAAKHAEIAIPASPTNSEYSLIAAAAYARLDQMDKAKAAIEEVNRKRKGDPGRKFDEYWRNLWLTFKYFKKDEDRERIQNALLKAGILE
jgi:tetratricopeptide (TPR) repeat protein